MSTRTRQSRRIEEDLYDEFEENLDLETLSDEELEAAAMSAEVLTDAHKPDMEVRLDSGNEQISFSVPRSDEEEDGV